MVEALRGRVLGGFEIGEFLAEGSYGWVYRARQANPDREVVVKVLRHKAPDLARVNREAQSLARVSHPNAVKVLASGIEDDGLMWIAMELVPGTDLRTWIASYSPMPLADVVGLIEQIADAVYTAHRRGIVHRDLKPENIMVTPRELDDGKVKLTPTLLDFGIAKWLDDVSEASPELADTKDDDQDEPGASDSAVTSRGVVSTSRPTRPRWQGSTSPVARYSVGTREYRAPEMWQDPRSAGPAADVYAMGIIAYEALAGRLPFHGSTKEEWQNAHRLTPVEPVGDSTPAVFDALSRALAKSPQDRPAPLEFARELRAALTADPAEQIKTSARLWEARGRSRDLLWGPTALAAAEERRAKLAQGDVVTRAFLTASRRRIQAARWKVVAVVLTIALAGGAYRMYKDGEAAEALLIRAEVEQGRQALLHSESADAQLHLGEAYRRGDHSPATEFMLARAIEPRLAELARFSSPTGHMWSAAFSPGGQRIVTTDDRAAQVWDAASHQLLFTMPHGNTVYQAMYSHRGTAIITACNDGVVRIWDASAGRLVRELRGASRSRYFKVDTSVDDTMVAAIDVPGAVASVWDARTGALLAELSNDGSEFPSVAFSVDGQWLATTGGDNARVFHTRTWAQVFSIPGPGIRTLSWDPTGSRLLTGSTRGDASIWEIPGGARIHHLREIGEPIDRVAFAPSGDLVVTASRDGSEEVWSARSGALESRGNQIHDKIFSIEFDATSKLVLAAGAGGAVAIADAAQGMLLARLEGQGVIRTAHFDPSSRLVVGASMDGTARVWNATAPYLRWSSPPVGEGCSEPQSLAPDQQFVVTTCKNHNTLIWNTARNQLLAELPGLSPVPGDFETAFPAISAAGDRAAIARGNTVETYELPGGKLVRTVKHAAAVSSLAFATAGRDIVSGAIDGSLLVTRENGVQLALPPFTAGVDAVGFLPDGRVVAADARQRLRVFDSGGAVRAEFEVPGRVRLLRASPDGQILAVIASLTKAVQPTLFDLTRYRRIAPLEGHLGIVYSARFVRDGRELITAGIDGTARRWDAATGELLQTYRSGSRFLADATVSPDGAVVIGGGADGMLRFWDLASGLPLWTLTAHKSPLVGLHFEGDAIVSRGLAGDVSRWVVPDAEHVIAACRAHETCGIVPP